MEEQWKDIIGYVGLYQISNYGFVKSIARNGTSNEDRILQIHKDKDGYSCVSLIKNGRRLKFLVHRLVAIHFVKNPNNYTIVKHIDGDKDNNYFENLEWCKSKKTSQNKGIESSNAKLTAVDIEYIRDIYVPRHKYFGITPLSKMFNVSKSTISYIVNNKTYIGE